MPSLTLAQLRADFTLEQATDELVGLLDGLGFAATSWQSGSVQRGILMAAGYTYYAMRQYVSAVSYHVFNDTAVGDALTDFSQSRYDNTREVAVAAQHACTLTGGAVGPPYTVAARAMVASDGTRTFRNVAEVTVPASGTAPATFEAEVAGTDGNVGVGTITSLVTPYAGVSITNTAVSRVGTNEETNEALRLRNSSKWSTLSVVETIADRYEYVARTVLTNARVAVNASNPDGPGTMRVYLAAEDGVAGGADVIAVQAAVNALAFGGSVAVMASTAAPLAITATIYYSAGTVLATVQAAVTAAIAGYINGAPIGGYDYSPGPSAVIDRDGLLDAIRGVTGVRKVTMGTPSGDTSVLAYTVATVGTQTLTYTQTTA